MPVTAARIMAVAAAVVLVCGAASAQQARTVEVLFEAGFEEDQPGELPEGWTPFSGAEGMSVTTERAHEGARSLLMVDDSQERAVGPRSPQVPVKPGEFYSVEGWYFAAPGQSMSLYLEFWDAEGKRIADCVRSFGVSGAGGWTKASGTEQAPAGAVAATTLPYSHSQNVATGYWDDIRISRGIPIMFDRTPQPPAPVEHPCGLYDEDDIERALSNIRRHQWAAQALESIRASARWWLELPDEQIADWIPQLTPFRAVNCPNCQAQWGIDPFTHLGDGRFQCRRCQTTYPNEQFPENGVEVFINPLGQEVENRFHQDAQGRRYRLSGYERYCRILRLSSLGSLGRAYALTGETAYAEKVRKVLLRLAEVYPGYVPHDWDHVYVHYNNLQSGKLSGWKLHDATTFIELCLAYDLTVASGVYSAEDRSLIEEGVFREGARLITSTSPRGCCVNDGPFLMAAGAFIGRLLADHECIRWALEPPDGFFGFIEENFWRDGHWEDGSPSYEHMALSRFAVLPEILHGYSDPPDYAGDDRYQDLDIFSQPLLRKVLVASLTTLQPDLTLPAINDSTMGAKCPPLRLEENYFWYPTERNLRLLQFARGGNAAEVGTEYTLFRRDPELSFEGIEPLDPAAHSLVRPGLGWAILRAGERPEMTMLVLDYGPSRGHSHPDKLNYLLWAYGREIVPDQGYLGARHHYTPWLSSTAAHNVVMVNGEPQRKTAGELLSFISGELAQSVRARAPATFEGTVTNYERTLVLMTPPDGPPYVADVFRVAGGDRHVMAFHGEGEGFACELSFAPHEGEVISRRAAGGDWLKEMQRAAPDGHFTATWEALPEGQPGVRLHVLEPQLGAVYHCTAPGLRERSTPWAERTMHLLLREQPGPNATFVAVAEAVRGTPLIRSVERLECSHPEVVPLRITRAHAIDWVLIGSDASAGIEVTCAALPGLRLTGRQAVLTLVDGEVAFAQLVDGTSLALGEMSLTCAGPMRGSIVAFDDTADTFTVDAALPTGDALCGAQFLVSGRVDGAYEIERVEAAPGGALVHLADEPIMRVKAGDAFVIPSVAELRRLDNGTLARRDTGE